MTQLVQSAINQGVFPGAAWAFGTGTSIETGAAGRFTYESSSPEVRPDTVYDLASVTKVLGTTCLAMRLFEQDRLDLDATVASIVPAFAQNGKGQIPIRRLLTHDSGLIWHRLYPSLAADRAEMWRMILAEPLEYPTGSRMEYSCVGFMALFQVLTTLLGCDGAPEDPQRAEAFAAEIASIHAEMGLVSTRFCPPGDWLQRIPPTEGVHGEVHDENARFLGGVSGNAGLFGTAADLARFAQAMLEAKVFRHETLALWSRRQSDDSTRALGFDTKSEDGSLRGSGFSARTFGHLGFTGTSVWIDPERGGFAVLLSNRVYPTRENVKILEFRPQFHQAVSQRLGWA